MEITVETIFFSKKKKKLNEKLTEDTYLTV